MPPKKRQQPAPRGSIPLGTLAERYADCDPTEGVPAEVEHQAALARFAELVAHTNREIAAAARGGAPPTQPQPPVVATATMSFFDFGALADDDDDAVVGVATAPSPVAKRGRADEENLVSSCFVGYVQCYAFRIFYRDALREGKFLMGADPG